MMQLIDLFLEKKFKITFATTATKTIHSEELEAIGIETKHIQLNDSNFDKWIENLNPDIVLFDRFMTEEQFGWRVSENCPKALRILDTEDLHFLRKSREQAVKGKTETENLFSDLAKREIASIYRSDLTLIISEKEMELLKSSFKIPDNLLFYLPFLMKRHHKVASFEERKDFLFVGNLQHAPNVDAVLELKKTWPQIKNKLPDTECHIYGAYAPKHISELNNPKTGFLIKGWLENLSEMNNYKLQLAPIRFGAGLKGKIADGFSYGLPTITTFIGAEGIPGNLKFGGAVGAISEFPEMILDLYTSKEKWTEAQQNGFEILEQRFDKEVFKNDLFTIIDSISNHLENHRNNNFIGQILQHHFSQSTKYMSRWIEEKNKNQENS